MCGFFLAAPSLDGAVHDLAADVGENTEALSPLASVASRAVPARRLSQSHALDGDLVWPALAV